MKHAVIVLLCGLLLTLGLACAGEKPANPRGVKVDMARAIELATQAFPGEDALFFERVELKQDEQSKDWRWEVVLQTYHAEHWGPASVTLDAMTGKPVASGNHKGASNHRGPAIQNHD